MHIIHARNVNEAYRKGLIHLSQVGEEQDSRAGKVLVAPSPVTTVYSHPWERVLLNPTRDANPFFHLFEALYLIAGCDDATWLDQFISDFSTRFAEAGGVHRGSYGYRWRRHFDLEGGGSPNLPDQLETVIRLLKSNPDDRRVALSMWDPVADLGTAGKDVPCNLMVIPRIRTDHTGAKVLDISVPCRSNDIIWGAYGANAVQFSFLQEYLAARLGVKMGCYYQISLNFHAYLSNFQKMMDGIFPVYDPYVDGSVGLHSKPVVTVPDRFDYDLRRFMDWTLSEEPDQDPQEGYNNVWFQDTAEPLFVARYLWRNGSKEHAFEVLQNAESMSPDWKWAAERWFQRRLKKKEPVEYER